MNKASHGLGRGLDALIKTTAVEKKADGQIEDLPLDRIRANDHQPRTVFDETALQELSSSVRQYGVLQPVLVRRLEKGYELIAGERRFRAAGLAGLKKIPAIVCNYDAEQVTEVALIENLQRQDLNAIEEAKAYAHLLTDFGQTQENLAKKVGRSRSHIANFLRLLNLPEAVQQRLVDGTLLMGQAKPLLALASSALQLAAADYIIEHGLSARRVEDLVRRLQKNPDLLKKKEPASGEKPRELFVAEAEDRLKMLFGTRVKIYPGKKKSRIEIEYYTPEDLDRIIETLTVKRQELVAQKKDILRQVSQKFTV